MSHIQELCVGKHPSKSGVQVEDFKAPIHFQLATLSSADSVQLNFHNSKILICAEILCINKQQDVYV